MPSREDAVRDATRRLEAAGVPGARPEARRLLEALAGIGPAGLLSRPEAPLETDAAVAFEDAVARRARRVPLAYITGHQPFRGLDFRVGPATLIPRPDSETVVAAALDHLPAAAGRVVDLGPGTGCLLLSVLAERPALWGAGVDRSPDALAVARANADTLGLTDRAAFACGDWADALADGAADLVVCNPPYVADREWPDLMPEVRDHEPPGALLAGPDGLDAHRHLAATLPRLLAPGGVAVLELGAGQAEAARTLYGDQNLVVLECRRDLGDIERALVVARRAGAW